MWTKVSDELPPSNVWIDVVVGKNESKPDEMYWSCLLNDPGVYCRDMDLVLWRIASGMNVAQFEQLTWPRAS
jgi:hypothetical protein